MKKIYIGNLGFETTDETLEAAFTPFGAVLSAAVIRDRSTGDSRGFGFVEMENEQEATAAIDGLNGQQLDGRTIKVSEARPREGGARGGRGNRPDSRGRGRYR